MLVFSIYLCFDFKLVQSVKCYLTFSNQCNETQSRIFLYSPYSKRVESKDKLFRILKLWSITTCCAIFVLYFAKGTYFDIFRELCMRLIFLVLMIVFSFTYYPDRHNVLKSKNLNLGYGAALWYYVNYLKLFLPNKFLHRVEQFETYNRVSMKRKHFILVPESCKVPNYLDCDTDFIERCKELPKHLENFAGVKERVYNITVYEIRKEQESKWIRLAVEYAQPLKGLYALKERHVIKEEEMINERKLFVLHLQEFLRDANNSYEFCELIEYNDKERKAYEVLLNSCMHDKACEV